MERRPILANIDCVGPGPAGLELRGPVNVCTLKINISVYAEQSYRAPAVIVLPRQDLEINPARHLNWSCLDSGPARHLLLFPHFQHEILFTTQLPPQMFSCDQNITTKAGDYTL